jgi:hypothetical protein
MFSRPTVVVRHPCRQVAARVPAPSSCGRASAAPAFVRSPCYFEKMGAAPLILLTNSAQAL